VTDGNTVCVGPRVPMMKPDHIAPSTPIGLGQRLLVAPEADRRRIFELGRAPLLGTRMTTRVPLDALRAVKMGVADRELAAAEVPPARCHVDARRGSLSVILSASQTIR
jgi:hypothetical protein